MKMNRWKLSKIGTPACYRKTGRKVMQATVMSYVSGFKEWR